MRSYIQTTLSTIIICTGLLVMVGWFTDNDTLTRIIPGFVTMKFTTALAFVMSGISLHAAVYARQGNTSWSHIITLAAVLVIIILMATLLISTLFGFKSGLEDLFVQESSQAILTTTPGRPSIGTMASFILIAIASTISLTDIQDRWIFRTLGSIVTFLGSIAVFGYMTFFPVLYYAIEGISTAMALHTGLLFTLSGITIWLLSYEEPKKGI